MVSIICELWLDIYTNDILLTLVMLVYIRMFIWGIILPNYNHGDPELLLLSMFT